MIDADNLDHHPGLATRGWLGSQPDAVRLVASRFALIHLRYAEVPRDHAMTCASTKRPDGRIVQAAAVARAYAMLEDQRPS